jgi:vacuolar protein sorting-associated protein 72
MGSVFYRALSWVRFRGFLLDLFFDVLMFLFCLFTHNSDSHCKSDKLVPMPQDSLVATRERRDNAGSRLKQLLRQEHAATGVPGDEDIDLLFVEDEDDDEFNEGDDVESYGPTVDGDDEDSDERDSDEQVERSERDELLGVEEGEEEEEDDVDEDQRKAGDSDEMFSDSEDSDDTEESDTGEKELQKQERQKKKEKQKKSRQIPKIKQAATSTKPKIRKKYVAPEPETLLSETRRQSSRTTVVQNKLDLVEKLRDEEARRASLKPVAKIEYREMTQEERLEEALETEKYNTSTLNKYQEQEIEKKKRQRALQLSKRKRLHDVVSFTTCAKFVTITEEHEFEKFLLTRDKLKKKDRRGRKSDKQKKEEIEEKLREERKRQRLEELDGEQAAKKIRLDESADIKVESIEEPAKANVDENKDGLINEEVKLAEDGKDEVIEEGSVEKDEVIEEGSVEKDEVIEDGSVEKDESNSREDAELSEKVEADPKTGDKEDHAVEPIEVDEAPAQDSAPIETEEGEEKRKEEEDEDVSAVKNEHDVVQKLSLNVNNEPVVKDEGAEVTNVKAVTFIDESQETTQIPTIEPTPSSREPTLEPPELEYEGPEQKVGVNLISFENKLRMHEIKSYLLGPDSILGPSRRFKDLEPLIHIQKSANELEQFQSLDSKLKLPDLSILDKCFPKFGEFNKVKTEQIIPEATRDIQIQLTTPAPTGVYLPNGNKKLCLITGKPAVYFDPKTGMPYSSVESYKTIQKIQEGSFVWGDFRKGGAYFEERENVTHAKGVPEGFGG